MAVIKCEMCGGELNFDGGESTVVCAYCGNRQTIPGLDSGRKQALTQADNLVQLGVMSLNAGDRQKGVDQFEKARKSRAHC